MDLIENLDKQKEIENSPTREEIEAKFKKLDDLTKYYRASYKWLHFLVLSLYASSILITIMVLRVPTEKMYIACIASALLFSILLYVSYRVGYNFKIKNNKLITNKIGTGKKIMFLTVSFIWLCAVTILTGFLYVAISIKLGIMQF